MLPFSLRSIRTVVELFPEISVVAPPLTLLSIGPYWKPVGPERSRGQRQYQLSVPLRTVDVQEWPPLGPPEVRYALRGKTNNGNEGPRENTDESKLKVTKAKATAVRIPAVANALKIAVSQMGAIRSAQTLLAVNQIDVFDFMVCAWPEEEKRHAADFCENGAKAVAEEATLNQLVHITPGSHP